MNTSTGAAVAQNSKEITDSPILGVWHRPNSSMRETNLKELCRVLDEFSEAGVNLVFVESFYHGMALFKNDMVEYHTRVREFDYSPYPDYLSAFAAEADKRGINVYAWVQDFYVGFRDYERLILENPDWILKNQDGSIRHMTEGHGFGGYIFLDPANSEVRDFLVRFYDDLLTKIPTIKGLNLDYIRYPISVFDDNTDTGYTEVCMKEFCKKHSLTLNAKNPVRDLNKQIKERGLLSSWTAHRASYITAFVEQVRTMVNSNHPGKKISTAVFSEIEQTYHLKKQSICVWLERGYVDFVTPMVYYYEASQVFEAIQKLKAFCKGVKCYTGLYTTYHKQSIEDLASHIDASESAGADGLVLFDAAKTFFEAEQDYKSFLAERYKRK